MNITINNILKIITILPILLYMINNVVCQFPEIKDDRFIQHRQLNKQLENNLNNTYFDFIVVGAGSAGCVLAKRLSENRNISVLVLEAGGPDNLTEIATPALSSLLFKTKYDWDYQSSNEPTLKGRSVYIPRGKVVGGSSSINAMIVSRGDKKIFNVYDHYLDLDGWKWEDILPYFKKSQKYLDNDINFDYQSDKGEWKQRSAPYRFNITKTVINYLLNKGKIIQDVSHQDGDNLGFNYNVNNIDEFGRRHSLADAFLTSDVLQRGNLYVRPFSQAIKILFNKQNKNKKYCILSKCYYKNTVAKGIQFIDTLSGNLYNVYSNKEIILSAGAIATPHLLLLSGIGNKRHLKNKKIKVIKHIPSIGRNLQDHPLVGMTFNITSSTYDTLENSLTDPSFVDWLFTGKGPFTSSVDEGNSYEKSKFSNKYFGGLSDYKILIAPAIYINDGLVKFPPPTKGFSIGIELTNAKSRGYVKLKSSNPFDKPLIRTNYYKNINDLKIVLHAMKSIISIFRNDSFFQSFIDNEIVPGEHVVTNRQFIDYIRQYTGTGYHSCCTVSMGKSSFYPLDERLKLKNIDGLRVVDASIFPVIPSGNPNANVVMAAEKASDMIYQDNNIKNC